MYYAIALLALVGFLWLVVALPQRRVRRRHEELVGGLEVGQEVMTAGGIYGVVKKLEEGAVSLEIASGVEITLARGAVAAVIEPEPLDSIASNRESSS